MLLEGGIHWKPLTINPQEAQMLETRAASVAEICRYFCVPPFMIGQTEKSTSWGTGIEQQTLAFQKFTLRRRLKRIEGQIRGIARMIEEDRYCPEILIQISAASESLRSTARVLLDSHVRHCVTDAIRSKDTRRTEEVYQELSDLFAKFAK